MEFNANQFGSGAKAAPVLVVEGEMPDERQMKSEAKMSASAESFVANIRNGTPEKNLEAPVPEPAAAPPMPIATKQQLLGDYLPDFSDIIMPRLNLC